MSEELRLGVPDMNAVPPGSVVHVLWDMYYVRTEKGLWLVQAKKRKGEDGFRIVKAVNLSVMEVRDGDDQGV